MNALIVFLIIGVPVLALAALIVLVMWHAKQVASEGAVLDYQIAQAIDRGDYTETERLREKKIELMLYGE